MAPEARRAPLTSPAKTITYFRKRRPRGVTRLSCSPRQYHQEPRDRLFQAALDLVAAGPKHVLALGGWVLDVPVFPHELPEGEDRPATRLVEAVEHLLLAPRHRQDHVRLGEQVPMPLQVGRGEGVLGQVDALLAQRQPRIERGEHAVARVVGDAAGPDAYGAVGAVLRQHALQE